MRKIIQISSCGVQENIGTQCEALVFALCDDGTMLVTTNRDLHKSDAWSEVAPIPEVHSRVPVSIVDAFEAALDVLDECEPAYRPPCDAYASVEQKIKDTLASGRATLAAYRKNA